MVVTADPSGLTGSCRVEGSDADTRDRRGEDGDGESIEDGDRASPAPETKMLVGINQGIRHLSPSAPNRGWTMDEASELPRMTAAAWA